MVCGRCRVKHFLFLFRSNQQPPPSHAFFFFARNGPPPQRWCRLPNHMSHMTRHSGTKNPLSWGVWAHTFATCHIFIQKNPPPWACVPLVLHTSILPLPKIILALALVCSWLSTRRKLSWPWPWCAPGSPHSPPSSAEIFPGAGLGVALPPHTTMV